MKKEVLLLSVLLFSIYSIIVLSRTLPKLYVPHTLDQVKELEASLSQYAANEPTKMFILFSLAYLLKQAFLIPGSGLANICAYFIFGYAGFPIVVLLTATGSTMTYLLSRDYFGSFIFRRLISEETLMKLRGRVDANREHLLLFMTLIRFVPLVPGAIISLSAPFLQIPLNIFFISTLIGAIPYCFICVSSASMIRNLNSLSDIFSFWSILKLLCIISIILVPLIFKAKLMSWMRVSPKQEESRKLMEIV